MCILKQVETSGYLVPLTRACKFELVSGKKWKNLGKCIGSKAGN